MKTSVYPVFYYFYFYTFVAQTNINIKINIMKKIKQLKPILLLVAVLTFSMCEENGPIQFAVADDFETTVDVEGLIGLKDFTIESSDIDVSDLLDNADNFVDADVESVTLTLLEYSGESITGDFAVFLAGKELLNVVGQTLSATPLVISIPVASKDILSLISSGKFSSKMTGSAEEAITDENFKLNLKFKIKATVE